MSFLVFLCCLILVSAEDGLLRDDDIGTSADSIRLATGSVQILQGCAALRGLEPHALLHIFHHTFHERVPSAGTREGREFEESLQALSFACQRLHAFSDIAGQSVPMSAIPNDDGLLHRVRRSVSLLLFEYSGWSLFDTQDPATSESNPGFFTHLGDGVVEVTTKYLPWLFYCLRLQSIWSIKMVICIIVLAISVGLFERAFLRSTLGTVVFGYASPQSQPQEHSPSKLLTVGDGPRSDEREIAAFWATATEALERPVPTPENETGNANDVVAFMRHNFAVFESSRRAKITLIRRGACDQELRVKARTAKGVKSAYCAIAGVDYEDVDIVVTFLPGQTIASFDVPIHITQNWDPTRWFHVELVEILEGEAVFGGPTTARWVKRDHEDAEVKAGARVYILEETQFPFCLPASSLNSPMWLSLYYIRDRIQARGEKYWKTLLARLYEPFHKVVVTGLVQRRVINLATSGLNYTTGIYEHLAFAALIQLASTFFLRWANYEQTQNRGRTGGVRMQHRWQLFSKLMMMELSDHLKVPGSTWFYTAIAGVDTITVDGYWQSFELMTGVFGLILSVLTLVLSSVGSVTTVLGETSLMFAMIPISAAWIYRRQDRVADMLGQRMKLEADWMETFSWLAHAGPNLHSLGPGDMAFVEQQFAEQSKTFVARHQNARDLVNDSNWVTLWLSSACYIMILLWGSQRLASQHEASEHVPFKVGQFVLILKLYKAFGKYTAKISHSCVALQRSSVAIKRLSELLNLPEHGSMQAEASAQSTSLPEKTSEDSIEFQDVEFEFPKHLAGLTPMASLKISSSVVPLHHVVRVTGASENERMTFMALLANVLHPSRGKISFPSSSWAMLLQPLGAIPRPPRTTVLQALTLCGAEEHISLDFARILNLEPFADLGCLATGQHQVLALACALLRDPEILVAIRPLSLVDGSLRPRLRMLLRLWQVHGTKQIVLWLQDTAAKPLACSQVPRSQRRTLIITGEDMECEASSEDLWYSSDAKIDLGEMLGAPNN